MTRLAVGFLLAALFFAGLAWWLRRERQRNLVWLFERAMRDGVSGPNFRGKTWTWEPGGGWEH